MVTPLGWLERIPTYKEQLDQIKNKDLHTYGFLGYPTLQTADIVLYSDPGSPAEAASSAAKAGKGLFVPVGEDQVSHVEFSRELVRKFNFHFGFWMDPAIQSNRKAYDALHKLILRSGAGLGSPIYTPVELESSVRAWANEIGHENFLKQIEGIPELRGFLAIRLVLTEPRHLLTPTPRIPGLDGRKMSKSYNNAITLSESDDDIRKKTKVMVTDPARKRRTDPGNPDICPVYDWHKLFSTPERDPGRLDWVRHGCTTAGIGCIECKSAMAENLIKWITPVREKRLDYEAHPKKALEILDAGSVKARESAKLTIQRVREAIFHWPQKRAQISG